MPTQEQVLELVAAVLSEEPLTAEPLTLTHSGNTIYAVTLRSGRRVIARLRGPDKDTLSHTEHNLRALSALGLPVPRVLAADTSLARYPFRYILLDALPGRDLLYELGDMTRPQMTRLAEQIVGAQRLSGTLPHGTGFGWGPINGGGADPVWFDVFRSVEDARPPARDGSRASEWRFRLHSQRTRFQPYFQRLVPVCFLEDLTTKNILLDKGELTGLIDFDCVCFGDPLWQIGLAAGCLASDLAPHDSSAFFYIAEICRFWNLADEQRAVVRYYAAQRAYAFWESAPLDSPTDTERSRRLEAAIEHWLAEFSHPWPR